GLLDALFGPSTTPQPQASYPQQRVMPAMTPMSRMVMGPRGGGQSYDDDDRQPRGGRTYRTMCVRLCDGYYFPISYQATRSDFLIDQKQCSASCADARLYVYPNPGGDISDMTDMSGRAYSSLPNAFRYRKRKTEGCLCRAQPWSEQELARHRSYTQTANQRAHDELMQALAHRLQAKGTTLNPEIEQEPEPALAAEPRKPTQSRKTQRVQAPQPKRAAAIDAKSAAKVVTDKGKADDGPVIQSTLPNVTEMPDTLEPSVVTDDDLADRPSIAQWDLTPKSLAQATPVIERFAYMPLGGKLPVTKAAAAPQTKTKASASPRDQDRSKGSQPLSQAQLKLAARYGLAAPSGQAPQAPVKQLQQPQGQWAPANAPPPQSQGILSGLFAAPQPPPPAPRPLPVANARPQRAVR
ncbi:MAG: hypothetical protein RL291_1328, partial [Pseudomonadota bacterium]